MRRRSLLSALLGLAAPAVPAAPRVAPVVMGVDMAGGADMTSFVIVTSGRVHELPRSLRRKGK